MSLLFAQKLRYLRDRNWKSNDGAGRVFTMELGEEADEEARKAGNVAVQYAKMAIEVRSVIF